MTVEQYREINASFSRKLGMRSPSISQGVDFDKWVIW